MPTTLEQIQYGFDRDSRRTWKRRALAANEDDHYRYDALSQVTTAARGNLNLNLTAIGGRPASEQRWDYDPTGNWRGFDAAENGNPVLDQHRVHDRGNRLTQIEGNANAMILDRAGRMRQAAPDADGDWSGNLELTWDAWSRVTSVKSNGATVGEYQYDGLTRRTTREVSGVTWHSYYSDAWRPLEERKNAETTAALSYLWGARHRDDLVRRDRAVGGTTLNETRYVLMDYFSAAAIADEDGEVKERYAYSAFGVRRVLTPEFATRSTSECGFEFGFQGQFLDVESGLYNYGYRYYSPELGRWLNRDPIEETGGFNLYGFLDNDPTDWIDLLGYAGCSPKAIANCKKRCLKEKQIYKDCNYTGTVVTDLGGVKAVTECYFCVCQTDPCRGIRDQLDIHRKKLSDYQSDPLGNDNKGFLADADADRAARIYNGRVNGLENQIKNFEKLLRECEQNNGL